MCAISYDPIGYIGHCITSLTIHRLLYVYKNKNVTCSSVALSLTIILVNAITIEYLLRTNACTCKGISSTYMYMHTHINTHTCI